MKKYGYITRHIELRQTAIIHRDCMFCRQTPSYTTLLSVVHVYLLPRTICLTFFVRQLMGG